MNSENDWSKIEKFTIIPPSSYKAISKKIIGYKQKLPHLCGYCSFLVAYEHFFGNTDGVKKKHVHQLLKTNCNGTRQRWIEYLSRQYGLSVSRIYDKKRLFDKMARGIDRGGVVIVDIDNGEHWVVVCGYSKNGERILVCDSGSTTKTTYTYQQFLDRKPGAALIISPKNRL